MSAASIGDLIGWRVAAIEKGERINRVPRRDSYDENDPRAQIFRPICNGNRNEALRWCDKLLQTAREYNTHHKEKGQREGPLGSNGLWVLEVLLRNFVDFATGRCEPAIDTIKDKAKLARATVTRAIEALIEHGFLQKVRRTRKTGLARHEGPQREQISNAYAFVTDKMATRVRQRFNQLFGGRKRAEAIQEKKRQEAAKRSAALATPLAGLGSALLPNSPALASALDTLGASLERDSASSTTREYPESEV